MSGRKIIEALQEAARGEGKLRVVMPKRKRGPPRRINLPLRINARFHPDLHRRLVEAARTRDVSLNTEVNDRLERSFGPDDAMIEAIAERVAEKLRGKA